MLVIGRRTLLKGTIAGLTLAALPRIRLAHAQATEAEAISELAAMKAAATEYLAANGGRETLPTTRVDLARQAGDFALIYQYPSPGTGEIGQVLIAKQNGQWTGLTYGGIFPDEESRHGAPDALCAAGHQNTRAGWRQGGGGDLLVQDHAHGSGYSSRRGW